MFDMKVANLHIGHQNMETNLSTGKIYKTNMIAVTYVIF